MSENNTADVLNMDLLEGKNESKTFTKTIKIPEGVSSFRLLESPIAGQGHIKTHWFYWFKFNTVKDDGSIASQWRTGKNEFISKDHKNTFQLELLNVVAEKDKLAAPFTKEVQNENGQVSKKVDTESMPDTIRQQYRNLSEKERLLKPVRQCFVNAVDTQGNLVLLSMPKTAADEVIGTIKEVVQKGISTNPLSKTSTEGVWIEINRSGKGLQTKYSSKIKMIQEGDAFKVDKTPISQSLLDTYAETGQDLSKLFATFNDEELASILNGDIALVDNKYKALRGVPESTATAEQSTKTAASEVSSTEESSPEEEAGTFDNNVAEIEL